MFEYKQYFLHKTMGKSGFNIVEEGYYNECGGVFRLLSICQIKKGADSSIFILRIKSLDNDTIYEIVINADCYAICCEDIGFETTISESAEELDFSFETEDEEEKDEEEKEEEEKDEKDEEEKDEEIYFPKTVTVGEYDLIYTFDNSEATLYFEYATRMLDNGDESTYVKFTVSSISRADDVLWELKIHNIHNGYYSHKIDMDIKEVTKYNGVVDHDFKCFVL